MLAHSRKWDGCRVAALILCLAMALWLAAYWAAGTVFDAADTEALPGRTLPIPYTALEVPVRSSSEQDPLRGRLERLSEHEMKMLYARCSQESIERRLDGGEAMACSIGYDILLKKHFAGDFERFLLWSRSGSARAQ
jgi:hypothetical protein